MKSVKLTDNERRKIRFLIHCHLKGAPSLEDIQVMDSDKGFFPDTDTMTVKRFDTTRKGWTDGYFHVSMLGNNRIVYLLFGDSDTGEVSKRQFYLPKEGESPSKEWSFISRHLEPEEDGTAFLNRFSDCFTCCGVEAYLCNNPCLFIESETSQKKERKP